MDEPALGVVDVGVDGRSDDVFVLVVVVAAGVEAGVEAGELFPPSFHHALGLLEGLSCTSLGGAVVPTSNQRCRQELSTV